MDQEKVPLHISESVMYMYREMVYLHISESAKDMYTKIRSFLGA